MGSAHGRVALPPGSCQLYKHLSSDGAQWSCVGKFGMLLLPDSYLFAWCHTSLAVRESKVLFLSTLVLPFAVCQQLVCLGLASSEAAEGDSVTQVNAKSCKVVTAGDASDVSPASFCMRLRRDRAAPTDAVCCLSRYMYSHTEDLQVSCHFSPCQVSYQVPRLSPQLFLPIKS